jgi:adenylate cyclase
MATKHLTVGFADLSNFLRIQREQSTEDCVQTLQSFFQSAGDAIYAHGGRIIKYIGDAILFTFPDPREAVAAAREIAALEVSGSQVHVSLATGEVVEGPIGHPSFQVNDVLGPAVSEAALLLKEAAQAPDRLALCEETKRRA